MVNQLCMEYRETPLDILAFKLGVTQCAVKNKAHILGLKKRKELWEPEEDRLLKKLYQDHTVAEMKEALKGRSAASIYRRAQKLGLNKTKEHLASLGRKVASHPKSIALRFKKGNTPYNKGKRELEFRSKNSSDKCRATQFKAGQKPQNTRPVGYESVHKDGYVYIKVSDDMPMQPKHRVIWERHHGKVPNGMCVSFVDGNRQNCAIENLMLITNAEKATRVTSSLTPEQNRRRIEKAQATRNKAIRRDKMRIRWGLEPIGNLVKRWHAKEE